MHTSGCRHRPRPRSPRDHRTGEARPFPTSAGLWPSSSSLQEPLQPRPVHPALPLGKCSPPGPSLVSLQPRSARGLNPSPLLTHPRPATPLGTLMPSDLPGGHCSGFPTWLSLLSKVTLSQAQLPDILSWTSSLCPLLLTAYLHPGECTPFLPTVISAFSRGVCVSFLCN